MPKQNTEALGTSDKALPDAKQNGFPITSSEGVQDALTRSLEQLQNPSSEADPAPDETDSVRADEPPPETATDSQDTDSQTLSGTDDTAPETDADPDDEEQDAESAEDKDWERARQKMQARIDKLTKQRSTLEQQINDLKTQQDQPQPTTASQDAANPLGHVNSQEELRNQVKMANDVIDYVDRLLIELETDPDEAFKIVAKNGRQLNLSEDPNDLEVATVKRALLQARMNADRRARVEVPARAEFLAAQKQAEQLAAKTFDWWKQEDSQEHEFIANQLRSMPQLSAIPGAKMALGYMVEGYKAIMAKDAKGKKPAESARPSQVPPKTPKRPTMAASRVPEDEAKLNQQRAQFNQAPTAEGLMNLLQQGPLRE